MTSRYRWVILGVGAAGAGAFSALQMGLPALGPALRTQYGLSLAQIGLALAAVAVGVMLTLVPWGVLTDRVGERPVMTAGLAGTALALAGTAFAPGFGLLLVLTAALAGAPGALLYPALLFTAVSTMTWNGLAFTAAAEISGPPGRARP